jgi:RHH-type transcriptional regulator, proline utilization regulon repressor / proline dehydrogenase / delta 1-pyrroline-5-carboxylate dehydrogenase
MPRVQEYISEAHELLTALPIPDAMAERFLADEARCVDALLAELSRHAVDRDRIGDGALQLAERARQHGRRQIGVDSFLKEYSLSSEEGVVLMCLAEALIRIPDDATALALVEDRLEQGQWDRHIGRSDSVLVNASTWGLLLTGRLFQLEGESLRGRFRQLVRRIGREWALKAIRHAMTIVGQQFVVSESIESALKTVGPYRASARRPELRYSFDMLGEAALCDADADAYHASYLNAIERIGTHYRDAPTGIPAISIKLSALEPRFEPRHLKLLRRRLADRVGKLLEAARALDVQVTIDAEEAARHHLTLTVFADLAALPVCQGWSGLGIAVQAYQKRAPQTVDWLAELAREHGIRFPVRLVKGAYWDTEVKRAQQLGLRDYPVYVRKQTTDVSYLVCAHRLLAARDALYGQFATHNAHTLAAVLSFADHHQNDDFEVQRLFGMGEGLSVAMRDHHAKVPQRVYAPVGPYKSLLPYLMRRLLENGANSSFVHHLSDERRDLRDLIRDPAETLNLVRNEPPPVPPPADIYLPARKNSSGLNFDDPRVLDATLRAVGKAVQQPRHATCLVPNAGGGGAAVDVVSPADTTHVIGSVRFATAAEVEAAMDTVAASFDRWRLTPAEERARIIEALGDALLAHRIELLALLLTEAGKDLQAADAEVREAVDFCRYYALQARQAFAEPTLQPGPTGERNRFYHDGLGPFVCIAPWNFPLAIFTGQFVAALLAGNTVIAKPSELTNLIAHRVVTLAHEAGVPQDVLCLLLGPGPDTAAPLLRDPRLGGVAFTGGTPTAQSIHKTMADRKHGFARFIAETGGINALIADSSALVEQVVRDILMSAFDGAGQRCSALRVLFVQEAIADDVVRVLTGALTLWEVGHPARLSTDMGPVINAAMVEKIDRYLDGFPKNRVHRPSGPMGDYGHFVRPAVVELDGIRMPELEIFGPVLHVVRYPASAFDHVLATIRDSGFALTLGLHSRIEGRADYVADRLPVGNFYVNRTIIGATVETQPFGGFRLSGTGPKAGGPNYVRAFGTERTVTINTAAVGGDAELLGGLPPV